MDKKKVLLVSLGAVTALAGLCGAFWAYTRFVHRRPIAVKARSVAPAVADEEKVEGNGR